MNITSLKCLGNALVGVLIGLGVTACVGTGDSSEPSGVTSSDSIASSVMSSVVNTSSSAVVFVSADLVCPAGFDAAPVANTSFFCVDTRPASEFTVVGECTGGLDVAGYCFYPEHECAWGLTTDACIAACADNPSGVGARYCGQLASVGSGASSSASSACPNGSTIIFGNTCGYDDTCAYAPEQCQSSSSSSVQQSALMGDQFNNKPCGVGYDAMGNGSWQACFTLANGTASCIHKENPVQPVLVTWSDGSPVVNAAQVTGAGYYDVTLVTTEGKVYFGNRTSLRKDAPLFELGGISASGGQNTRCAMINDAGLNDVRCWTDNSDPYRPELPLDFNAMQLSANYSDICALSDNGEVWCWQQKPDNSLDFVGPNPSKAPFSEPIISLSVGQLAVCGVKLSGGLECLARWDSTGYLPTQGSATDAPVSQIGMQDVISFQAGFGQGVSIHSNGAANYWQGGSATAFAGVSDAVAAGGDRGVACVLTAAGDVYCLDADKQPVKVTGDIKAMAGACPL